MYNVAKMMVVVLIKGVELNVVVLDFFSFAFVLHLSSVEVLS